MKYSKISSSLLLLLLMVFVGSCKKEPSTLSVPSIFNFQDIENFFEENEPPIQSFVFDANQGNTIIGTQGTKITIPQNAFVNSQGNLVTGQVKFELQEIYSVSDMIFTGKMTESNGQMLGSGGEMFLEATQNGSPLEIANGRALTVSVPTANPTPQMGLFVGSGSGSNFTWVPDTATTVNVVTDTTGQGGGQGGGTITYYQFDLGNLWNWINCDYFWTDPRPKTDIEIQVPTGYDLSNTNVFVYIPSVNSVARTYYNSTDGSYYIYGGSQLPVGISAVFIGVHFDGTDFYYSIQNAIIVNNHVEVLSFQLVTKAQLLALLQNI